VQAETSSPSFKVLSEISEDRPGSETEFKRIELFTVLREHATAEATESWCIPGKENRE
jgi:hypothetical protein